MNNTEKEFDLLVFVGRFQPLHLEHKRVIDIALQKSRHVLVLVGSAGKARTIRNPFTFDERRDMITGCYENDWDVIDPEGQTERRLIIRPLYDKTYNDAAWVKQVQELVKDTTLDVMNPSGFMASGYNDAKVGLIGASKDNSSYYLKLFPQWKSVNVEIEADVHATTIRESFLEYSCWKPASVPSNVADFMTQFTYTAPYAQLKSELQFVRDYKKQWEVSPYPVKHATVDAVVEQSGHILLVKRKAEPGKGLWALPGGHLNEFEKQLDGAIRELREETGKWMSVHELDEKIASEHVFDHPKRDPRGRCVTHAFLFKLHDKGPLPLVEADDDASEALWMPFSDVIANEEQFYADHCSIINYFVSKL